MRFIFGCFLFFISGLTSWAQESKIDVLILSGSNNHQWQNTTSVLANIYTESNKFNVCINENPAELLASDLAGYDVIVSNWNSWPQNDVRWPMELEKALLKFIENGGGFVTFHASSSAFYNWPEFKTISTSAWVDSTWHGKKSATQVLIQNRKHQITKGMEDFFIEDELWVNAEINTTFEILGSATNTDIQTKEIEEQPTILVKEFGNGRIFHTTLGHDARTMRNLGFKTLMLRGTEWAATGKVKQKLPQELQVKAKTKAKYSWAKTDTTFALRLGESVVWQYNFNEFHGKPFFHPVNIGRNSITCVSPDDHPWHLGQWFSWKFINGVNYWEYVNKNEYHSEGVTEIENITFNNNSEYSATIELDIVYRPRNGENVLTEKRMIRVGKPNEDGGITMDYSFEFTALLDSVLLDRTPILGEENGKSWGGYSGLSIRFNQSFMDAEFLSSWGDKDTINGKNGDWLYMGFTGLDGKQIGSQIIVDPKSQKDGARWYSVNTNDLPFYYFSPAILYKKPLLLFKGEKLYLNYRINHITGVTTKTTLKQNFQDYKKLNQ